MGALEFEISTAQNAIDAEYTTDKVPNIIETTYDKVQSAIIKFKSDKKKDDINRQKPPKNLLDELIHDVEKENREEGYTITKEDANTSYIKPERNSDYDIDR